MKKACTITVIVVAAAVGLQLMLPGVHGDGTIWIKARIVVVDSSEHPIGDAEVRMKGRDGTDITVANTDESGCAEIRVQAGWGTYISGLHTRHDASISDIDYTVDKEGYRPARLEFPQTRFRWHEFLGMEIGRPRLKLRCILAKTTG